MRTPSGSSKPVTGVTFAVHTPPHYIAGKGPADKEDQEDDDDEDDDEDEEDEAPGFCIHHHQRDRWQ
jgi:hypothetical protein